MRSIAVRGHSGLLFARAPRARQKTGARVECASARFASGCGSEGSIQPHRPIQPHLCAVFSNVAQRCGLMRERAIASRYGGERSIRPRHCAAFFKQCAKMRSNR
eukprot:7361613-Lingulodinium_polyedra.AAC.1